MSPAKSAKKGKSKKDGKRLVDLVQREVDDGATSVEEIHKAIASLPLDILERLDAFAETVKEVRKVQDTSIGAVYDVIRKVNQEVAKLAKEILAGGSARKPAAQKPARKAAKAHAA